MENGALLIPIVGMAIPILAIVLTLGGWIVSLWLDFQRRRTMFELHHKERMLAIERGLEVPPLPPEFFEERKRPSRSRGGPLRSGLIFLLVGVAVTIALWTNPDVREHAWWGLVPIAVGLANLIFYVIERRQVPGAGGEANEPGPPGVSR